MKHEDDEAGEDLGQAVEFVAHRRGRADVLISEALSGRLESLSRRQLKELFAAGQVRVDGRAARKGQILELGQQVELLQLPPGRAPLAVDLDVDVIFEDADLIAVAKPAGLASHPIASGERDTIANWLVHNDAQSMDVGDDEREAGLCHRLDRGTSGVLLAARNRATWLAMRDKFSGGGVHKRYLAVVERHAEDGQMTRALRRKGKRTVAADDGRDDDGRRPPTTRWTVSARGPTTSLLAVDLVGGRMHQIRAHVALAGHPIVGDELYGYVGPAIDIGGPFLHAHALEFCHPRTNDDLVITAELPTDRAALLQSLGLAKPDASNK